MLALDIGSHSVKLGEFAADNGRLTLTRFSIAPIESGSITDAVVHALSLAGIEPGTQTSTLVAIGGDLFIRHLQLPPVDRIQWEEMIEFEARQVVPFPLEEVVWDWVEAPGPGAEREALLIAVKADRLEDDYAAFTQAGLNPVTLDAAPLALYNAYHCNYPVTPDCILLADLGARTTTLLFIEGERFHLRSFNSVGDDLERISAELRRSIVSYRHQQGGTSPRQILLAGGGARGKGIEPFLNAKFGIPVDLFHPFQNIAVAPEIDAETLSWEAAGFGIVVGLAWRAIGKSPVALQLHPPSAAAAAQAARERPWISATLAVWSLLFLILIGISWNRLRNDDKTLDELAIRVGSYQPLREKMITLEKTEDTLSRRLEQDQKLELARDAWPHLLRELNAKAPAGVWITQLTPTDHGQALDAEKNSGHGHAPRTHRETSPIAITQLEIKGMFEDGLQPAVLKQYVDALAQTGLFDLDPAHDSDAIISAETPQADPAHHPLAWNYALSLKLKQPIEATP